MSARRSNPPEWGWHRLDATWAQRIVDSAPIATGDLVLDIGAGTGSLTAPLVHAGVRVVAVELHDQRVETLRRRFADEPVRVVQVDLRRLRLPRQPFRVVANPPFASTSELLRLLLSSERLLSADLVMQRAAAQRLHNSPPRGGHARLYQLQLGMVIPRAAFAPPPHVDLVVLQVRRRRSGSLR